MAALCGRACSLTHLCILHGRGFVTPEGLRVRVGVYIFEPSYICTPDQGLGTLPLPHSSQMVLDHLIVLGKLRLRVALNILNIFVC